MRLLSRRQLLFGVGALAVVGVPVAGRRARRDGTPRCEVDGVRIEPVSRVRAVEEDGQSHSFCCPRCARRWIDRQEEPPSAIYVIDEIRHEEIEAHSAHFVHSAAVTDPVTGNHIRAFRDPTDAEAHVQAFGGWVLDPAEYPFAGGSGQLGE
jgi:NosL